MSSKKVVHWPTGGGSWASALTNFAKTPSPQATLPAGVYLRSDESTLTIFDGYAKARFHFLVLPRIPFHLDKTEARTDTKPKGSTPQLGLTGNGKLSLGAASSASSVPPSHLASLNDLLASPYAGAVLSKLRRASEPVVAMIEDEMRHTILPGAKTPCGTTWGVQVGFHAVPSMEHVHLHIISQDLVSDRLKHKKHYLSFLHHHGFWLDLSDVEELVQRGQRRLPKSKAQYEALLRDPLYAITGSGKAEGSRREFANMPRLKEYLERAWIDDVTKRAVAAAAEDRRIPIDATAPNDAPKRSRSRNASQSREDGQRQEGGEQRQSQKQRRTKTSSSGSETASE